MFRYKEIVDKCYGGWDSLKFAWIQKNRNNVATVAEYNTYYQELNKTAHSWNDMISITWRQWAQESFLPIIFVKNK